MLPFCINLQYNIHKSCLQLLNYWSIFESRPIDKMFFNTSILFHYVYIIFNLTQWCCNFQVKFRKFAFHFYNAVWCVHSQLCASYIREEKSIVDFLHFSLIMTKYRILFVNTYLYMRWWDVGKFTHII